MTSRCPPDWRAALLLSPSGGDTLAASIAWLKAFPGNGEVTFTYIVTPVDIAGARGLPKSFVVDISRPTPTVRPATAELRVRQTLTVNQLPYAKAVPPNDLEIYLAINDPAWAETREEAKPESYGGYFFTIQRFYRLIVHPEAIEPAGHYVSDGATSRLRSPRTLATAHVSGESHFEIAFKDTQWLSKNNETEIKRIEEEKETLERIGRWARLTEEMPGLNCRTQGATATACG